MFFKWPFSCLGRPVADIANNSTQKDAYFTTGLGVKILGTIQLMISSACIIVGSLYVSVRYFDGYGHDAAQFNAGVGWGLIACGLLQAICGWLVLAASCHFHNDVIIKIIKLISILLLLGSVLMVFVLKKVSKASWGEGKPYYIREIVIIFAGSVIAIFASGYAKIICNRDPDPELHRSVDSSPTNSSTGTVWQTKVVLPIQSVSNTHGNSKAYAALTATRADSSNFGYESQQKRDKAMLVYDGGNCIQGLPYEV